MLKALGVVATAIVVLAVSGCETPKSMTDGFIYAGDGLSYRIGAVDCSAASSSGRIPCEGLIEVLASQACSELELDVSARYSSGKEVKRIKFPSRAVEGNSIHSYYPSAILPEATSFRVERLSCIG